MSSERVTKYCCPTHLAPPPLSGFLELQVKVSSLFSFLKKKGFFLLNFRRLIAHL